MDEGIVATMPREIATRVPNRGLASRLRHGLSRADGDGAAVRRRISPAQGYFSPRLILKRI
jgi:hypothetical protein